MNNDETAAGFIEARKKWFEVRTMDRPEGGWDVVLRIDGTYYGDDPVLKDELVGYFARWLDEVLANEAP